MKKITLYDVINFLANILIILKLVVVVVLTVIYCRHGLASIFSFSHTF